jgi:hypothetical protein
VLNDEVVVPDNTIAYFKLGNDRVAHSIGISEFIKKPENKRDWFTPHFYQCLPITIGNQIGFVVSLNFDFNVLWNGGDEPEDLNITLLGEGSNLDNSTMLHSGFGHGVITLSFPWSLRTPPGINLLTIAPPNYVLKNATPLTGSVETDNLRGFFTFNIRINEPHIPTHFPANTPLSAFIPIPRYFAESFELKDAEELFDKEVVEEEVRVYTKMVNQRSFRVKTTPSRNYFKGKDIEDNPFKDHQLPNLKKSRPN